MSFYEKKMSVCFIQNLFISISSEKTDSGFYISKNTYNYYINIFDKDTQLHKLGPFTQYPSYFSLSPNKKLLSICFDKKIIILNEEFSVIDTIKLPQTIKSLFCLNDKIIFGYADGIINIRDIESKKTDSLNTNLSADHIHADEKMLMIGEWDIRLKEENNRVKLYDINKKLISSINNKKCVEKIYFDEQNMYIGGWENTVKIMDFRKNTFKNILSGHTKCVTDFSIKGKELVSGSLDKTIRTWDINSGKYKEYYHSEPVNLVYWSNEIISAGENLVRFWN